MISAFNYVNGVCGSGKTYTAINKIAARVLTGETIIYATETIKLLKQTKDGLEALGIDCCLITSEEQVDWKSHYYLLLNDIIDAQDSIGSLQDNIKEIQKEHKANFNKLNLAEAGDWKKNFKSIIVDIINSITVNSTRPCVILCTTKSLIRAASSLPSTIKLPLYIDEGFVVAEAGEFISATTTEIQGLAAKLGLTSDKPEEYSNNNRYQLPDKLRVLEQYIANPLYNIKHDTSTAKFTWVASLDVNALANHFSEITLLAACHEDTLQYQAIKSAGCKQIELDWGLDTEHYTEGNINVYWVLNDRPWITTFKNTLTDTQLENIGIAFEGSHWSNEALSVKGISGVGKPLPVKSHGFNDASDNDHFLNLHTQMPIPYLNKFLKDEYRMSKAQIRQAYYHYDCYQAAMRVSLRNSTESKPRTDDNSFCFGDKATAQYFISKLASNVTINKEKLVVRTADELTLTWVVEELEVKNDRSDKVSANKTEQNKRSQDRAKLVKLNPDISRLDEALILLRDWRRDNKAKGKGKRMTPKLYEQVANDFN